MVLKANDVGELGGRGVDGGVIRTICELDRSMVMENGFWLGCWLELPVAKGLLGYCCWLVWVAG